MATIQKRNNSYQISVFVANGENGEKIRKTCTYKPTATTPKKIEKEVNAFALEFEKKVKNGDCYSGEKMTLNKVIEQWVESYAKTHLTIGQVEQYTRELKNRVCPSIGYMKIANIKPIHCQKVIDEMIDKGYAPKTVKRTYTEMSAIFSYAYRLEIIKDNPLSRVKLPPTKKDTELHYFTLEQAKTFLYALTLKYPIEVQAHKSRNRITGKKQDISEYTVYKAIPYQLQVFLTLALYGGFRRGELLALTWNDIDFDTNTVNIRHSTGLCSSGQYIKQPKTESGVRAVTMPSHCMSMLEEWYKQEKNLANTLGTAWQGKHGKMYNNSFIFIQANGKQMNTDTPYQCFKKIISNYNNLVEDENKKLPSIRLHDLRHTSATLLLSENVDIETVAKRLGHSNPSITLNVYGHALKSKDISASNTLDYLFNSANN